MGGSGAVGDDAGGSGAVGGDAGGSGAVDGVLGAGGLVWLLTACWLTWAGDTVAA